MPGTDVVDVEAWAEEARKQKLADKLKRLKLVPLFIPPSCTLKVQSADYSKWARPCSFGFYKI